ncbi:MAG: hypothetical protein JWP00_771 [Chloroflexi bacterium]|nr:hypothetical protein [Chloroflexota bacterium]
MTRLAPPLKTSLATSAYPETGLKKWSGAAYRPYWLLLVLALVIRFATALLFHQPGYTDAYYYSNVAESLWRGQGFREDYIWNYLARPLPETAVGNPGSLYWMPLTSVLIYFAYLLTGGPSFLASQLPGILFSAALAPLAFYLATTIFGPAARGRRYGWLAGWLVIFSGIYAGYFVLPDNFAPFALLSAAFLAVITRTLQRLAANRPGIYRRAALAGLLAGLAYLTRVDGLILVAVPFLVGFLQWPRLKPVRPLALKAGLIMLALFGLTVSPWLFRNLADTGQLFPGGGFKVLFWREYNDFFSFSKPLDLPYYLNLTQPAPDWGLGPLLGSKLSALLENLLIVGRGALFLTPLFVIGLFTREAAAGQASPEAPVGSQPFLWQRLEFQPFLVYTLLLYLAMSLAFTFPGTRGSVFHSSGGLLPYIFLVCLVGLDRVIAWLGKLSRPRATAARQRNYSLVVAIAFVCLSVGLVFSMLGNWNKDYEELRPVGAWLDANEKPDVVVMLPLGPAYWYVTHRPSVATASDPLPVNLEIARKYRARYLVLLPDHYPDSFAGLFATKKAPGFELVATFGEVQLYRLA